MPRHSNLMSSPYSRQHLNNTQAATEQTHRRHHMINKNQSLMVMAPGNSNVKHGAFSKKNLFDNHRKSQDVVMAYNLKGNSSS